MDRVHVEHLIKALRGELDQLEGEERGRLKGIADELERELASASEAAPGLLERAKARVEEFEVEHPRATGLGNRIMQTLADLGI